MCGSFDPLGITGFVEGKVRKAKKALSPDIPTQEVPELDDPRVRAARTRAEREARAGRGRAGSFQEREFASGEGVAGRGKEFTRAEVIAPPKPPTPTTPPDPKEVLGSFFGRRKRVLGSVKDREPNFAKRASRRFL